MTLIDVCRAHARLRASDPATVDGDVALSWAVFTDRVARAAAGFARTGVGAGDRVGILALNSADYLVAQLATWWIGAVVVPMNIRWSADENIYCARDAGLALLVSDTTFHGAALAVRAAVPALALVGLGANAADGAASFDAWVADNAPVAATGLAPDSLAGIYYTGGTTGFPKGVMLTHGALVAVSASMLSVLGMTSASRVLHAAPMFHLADAAMGHTALLAGACNIYLPRFEPAGTIEAIERYKVTDVVLVPTMIGMLLADAAYVPARLASLKRLCFGASPINATLLARLQVELPDVALIHCYGQTEMGPLVTFLDPLHQRPDDSKALSIGKPFPGVEVRIVDGDDRDVGANIPGEILARGPGMMRGYWNKPGETATTIVDGWVRTGDVATRDADGFMFICDRVKDMIITGGENVFSAEVENAVAAHPAVAQVAVIGIPDNDYGERVHAVIVARAGQTIDQEALFEHCRGLIANYKCPRSMEIRSEMPISGAGKILKRDLREPFWKGATRGVA